MARGTVHRSIRIPDSEWLPARERADREGESVTDVVRRALREYVTDPESTEEHDDAAER